MNESTIASVIARRERTEIGGNDLTAPLLPLPRLHMAQLGGEPFGTILADPPWRFRNRTGKVAPEHRRLARYDTMAAADIAALPVAEVAADRSHLYLWVPNALIADGLMVMNAWGFAYKSLIIFAQGPPASVHSPRDVATP